MTVFFQNACTYFKVSKFYHFIIVLQKSTGAIYSFIFCNICKMNQNKIPELIFNEKRTTLKRNMRDFGTNIIEFIIYYILHTVLWVSHDIVEKDISFINASAVQHKNLFKKAYLWSKNDDLTSQLSPLPSLRCISGVSCLSLRLRLLLDP